MRWFIYILLICLTQRSSEVYAQWWDTVSVGTTWYLEQHHGTIGRMIVRDSDGYLHMVWTNGTNASYTDRHVYYQAIDPTGSQLWPYVGYSVESSDRAGYTTVDVGADGRAYPSFHQRIYGYANFHTAVGVDFYPHAGAFVISEPDWLYQGGVDLEIIWPKMQVDRSGRLHVVATENVEEAGAPQRQYYTHGTYDPVTYSIIFPPEPDTWTEISHTQTIAADVTTSEVSDRVAFGWTYCRENGYPYGAAAYTKLNNDIYILIDEDGIDPDFSQAFNLTDFYAPALYYLPDTLLANGDTLRAYYDMSLFFDQDNWLHAAFTTRSYFELPDETYTNASLIWHWSEQFPYDFRLIANYFDPQDTVYCGEGNLKAQRPSLGQCPETGYLYCAYQVFDTDTSRLSWHGLPSGEIYVSFSPDGGLNWTVGTNITMSLTPYQGMNGECWSEMYPSMTKKVDERLHIIYILDRDAGWHPELPATIKNVKYYNPPTWYIEPEPYVQQDVPFHVEHINHVEGNNNKPPTYELVHQVSPNPFNPNATISFELHRPGYMQLEVFDITGRLIESPLQEKWLEAGYHEVTFDGTDKSSGVYIYSLMAGGLSVAGKMVLLK